MLLKKLTLLSLATSSLLIASGYRVPETSTNAVALSAANIANNKSADAAYYNPANMVFMDADKSNIEANINYIGLSKVHFEGISSIDTQKRSYDSKEENFIIPTLFYVSPKLGSNARVGLSIVTPAGLSKRWDYGAAKYYAQEFTLETIEINPTIAIAATEHLSFAFGLRGVYATGVIDGSGDDVNNPVAKSVKRSMTGSGFNVGYNVALNYKPTEDLDIAATYRSHIALNVRGSANLISAKGNINTTSSADVISHIPAVIALATSYTLPSKTTIELAYDRTLWSQYQSLDFNFHDAASEAVFGQPIEKKWKDANAYRVGLTQELDALTLMFGAVYDQAAMPDSSLNFETPDSNALSVSAGFRYDITQTLNVGLSALYNMHEDRSVQASDSDIGLNGKFSNSRTYLISTAIAYKF